MIVDMRPTAEKTVLSRGGMKRQDDFPVLIGAIALLLLSLAANVWGNFPTNDDWVYAHSAKHFAETGHLQVNVPAEQSFSISSLATLAGQTFLGGELVRLLGFHHAYLRGLTVAVAILTLWILNRILLIAEVNRSIRIFCLLLFVFNPISANLAFSFMTEYYGYVVAMAGALIWFDGRERADRTGSLPLISLTSAAAAGAAIGASFWIRQFGIAVLPALLMATAWSCWHSERRERLKASLVSFAGAMTGFLAAVGVYFWWARATGNLLPQSGSQVAMLTSFSPVPWLLMPMCALAYVTLFMLPCLATLRWRGVTKRPKLMLTLGSMALLTAAVCALRGAPAEIPDASVHQLFPYLKNILYNAGVGARTTTDLFIEHAGTQTHWDPRIWVVIEILLIGCHLLWAAVPRLTSLSDRRREICAFGMAFAAVSMAIIVQSSKMNVFDRYFFALLIGGTLSLGCVMPAVRLVWWRGGLVLLALAMFTTGGVHDYFGWNRARWELLEEAESRGVRAADIDGGWEVNGWSRFENPEERPALPVIRACAFPPTCLNDAFFAGLSVPKGYQVVASRRPQYWLGKGPDVVLCRRDDVKAGGWQ